ncbi:MAG: hypothetical protein AAGG72_05395 [Pseudomonadota bacterium]
MPSLLSQLQSQSFDGDVTLPIEPQSKVLAAIWIILLGALIAPAAAVLLQILARTWIANEDAASIWSSAMVIAGCTAWIAMWAVPLRRYWLKFSSKRCVRIVGRQSIRIDQTQFGLRTIRDVPLSQYTGLAHRVRTSLSDTQHELWLYHPRRAYSIPVATAPTISLDHAGEAADTLGVAFLGAGPEQRDVARQRQPVPQASGAEAIAA